MQPAKNYEENTLNGNSVATTATKADNPLLQKAFFISLLCMLLLTWVSGWGVGYHQDEIDMRNEGKANFKYYVTGGSDESYLKNDVGDTLMKYYGNGFEILSSAVNTITGKTNGKNEFNRRHITNQFLGILLLMFAGLISKRVAGWVAALLTIWLLYLSPSFAGHILFNTKDIPFCLGYIATIYYTIAFIDQLPKPTWKTTLCLMAAFAFANSIRIGGIILASYLFIFAGIRLMLLQTQKEITRADARNIITKLTIATVAGMAIAVLTWPFLLTGPVSHTIETLQATGNFPLDLHFQFSGKEISAHDLPATYIPKLLVLTTPVVVLLAFIAGMVIYFAYQKKTNHLPFLMVLTASIFPIVYAIATHTALYNGWRHLLFIYPGIVIIAASGIAIALQQLKKTALKIALLAVVVAGMCKPLAWSINNHPYEYTYFNELAGGFEKAYYNYDTDYWHISMKKTVDWLMTTEGIGNNNDTVIIASNIDRFVAYYLHVNYPLAKVKVVNSGVMSRNTIYWQYAVFNSFFLEKEYLEKYYPPSGTIFEEKIAGKVTSLVLKDTARLDLTGFTALSKGKYITADSAFTLHDARTHDSNPALLSYYALAKAFYGKNDSAILLANKALQFTNMTICTYNAHVSLGIAYANKQQYDISMKELETAVAILPNNRLAKGLQVQIYNLANAAPKQ